MSRALLPQRRLKMKHIVILGSTGSIGRNSLDVIEGLGDRFEVVGLSGGSNLDLLCDQAARHRPRMVCVGDSRRVPELRERLSFLSPQVVSGPEGLGDLATHPDADLVLNALVGSVGLSPTLAAIRAGKSIAIVPLPSRKGYLES